jgi:hypothetical protein
MSAQASQRVNLPEDVESELSARAQQMHGWTAMPIYLRDICAALRIPVKRHSNVPAGKAYLQWDRDAQERPTILLPLKAHKTWDRFCAAHELGHYILIKNYDWIPEDKETYWKTELLCDHFARELLIPDNLVVRGAREVNNPIEWLRLSSAVAEEALVPWLQTVHKISRLCAAVTFVRLEVQQRDGLIVSGSTLRNGRGTSMPIPTTSPLVERIRALREEAILSRTILRRDLELSDLTESKLGGFFREFGFTRVAVEVAPRGHQVRLAASK